MKSKAWICKAAGSPLEKGEVDLAPLGPNDVQVKITACGICASDVMILNLSLPMYPFPLVAGHEGVGVVTEVGSAVKHLKLGDRVGVGVYRSTCKNCKHCLSGEDNLCQTKLLTFMNGNVGAFSEYVHIDAAYAVPIPPGISDTDAAPLMCAGHTTFSPFKVHNIKVGDKVGIVGIGGLGHLSIQYASKLGCDVYVISSNPSKEAEAKTLGCHVFVNSADSVQLDKLKGTLNFIMVTASGKDVPWKALLAALAPNGKLILMGGGHDALPVTPWDLIGGQKSIVGSAAGSSANCREMLHLSECKNVKPVVQIFPFDKINEAISLVAKGQVRYRAVLTNSSL